MMIVHDDDGCFCALSGIVTFRFMQCWSMMVGKKAVGQNYKVDFNYNLLLLHKNLASALNNAESQHVQMQGRTCIHNTIQ